MLNIALAIRFLEKNKIDSNIQYALMAGRAYQSTRGNDNLFPEGNQDTTFLSKTLYSQHTKKVGVPVLVSNQMPLEKR